MTAKSRRLSSLACTTALALWATAACTTAQKSHDALARARHEAQLQNQRVLLLLRGAQDATELETALHDYRKLGKLLKYEYQFAAQPVGSLAGKHLRAKLQLAEDLATPALVVLDTKDKVLGTMPASAMRAGEGDGLDTEALRSFLESHKVEALDAKAVLESGLALARKTQRKTFVYLSAPW